MLQTNIALPFDTLVRDIQALGLSRGDLVYVHSSMKSIGEMEGGADTLLDAFLTVLGAEGTLAVPTHTLSFEFLRPDAFDASSTPSRLGLFTETVRRRKNAYRSQNPTHSSAAIGQKAKWLTANHDMSLPFGYDSPMHRLYRENGKILLLGVPINTNTMLHLAENLAELPYINLHYNENWGFNAHYVGMDGTIHKAPVKNFPGCAGGFPALQPLLEAKGLLTHGTIGHADCMLMESQPVVAEAIALLQAEPSAFLCKREGCVCCPPRWRVLGK